MKQNRWKLVLLGKRSKRPAGAKWQITSRPSAIRAHDGNLGLLCGEASNVVVLDFDDVPAMNEMMADLGPIPTTVITGSHKSHCYVQWLRGLPAKLEWKGKVIGEVQRGPRQQVVIPPSVHPDTGFLYKWQNTEEIPHLPPRWVQYLKGEIELLSDIDPEVIKKAESVFPLHLREDEPWAGPPIDDLFRSAWNQPGARSRSDGGVKFQCPGCKDEGHDRHRDNAKLFPDGHWACAIDADHKGAIGEVLGFYVQEDKIANEAISTEVAEELRRKHNI